MQKIRLLLPVILVISACTLPSSVDLKWSPDITIPSKSDFSSIFKNYILDFIQSDEYLSIIPCENGNPDMEFALNMQIIGEDMDAELLEGITEIAKEIQEIDPLFDNIDIKDITDNMWARYPIRDKKQLINMEDDDEPMSMSMADLVNVLDGFFFETINSKIYTGGTDIINSLQIEISIKSNNTLVNELNLTPGDKTSNKLSDFNHEWETCPWPELPEWGETLNLRDIINKQEEIEIRYKVYLKAGSVIKQSWFNNPQIRTELVMILPFRFVVDPDKGEADFIFPDFFGSSDLFGRNENDELNMIQYLEFNVKLNRDVFIGAILHIKSDKGDIDIARLCNKAEINMIFDTDTMSKINDPENIPFIPKMWYHFDKNDVLAIPQDFNTKELNFKTKLFYNVSLK